MALLKCATDLTGTDVDASLRTGSNEIVPGLGGNDM